MGVVTCEFTLRAMVISMHLHIFELTTNVLSLYIHWL